MPTQKLKIVEKSVWILYEKSHKPDSGVGEGILAHP